MRLIIGGRSQGKLDLLLSEGNYTAEQVTNGAECPLEAFLNQPVLDQLHVLVRRWTATGASAEELRDKLLNSPLSVILCDEIGSGIVPMDPKEEQWREDVGRICCDLAAQCEVVDRVYCGLLQRIKG